MTDPQNFEHIKGGFYLVRTQAGFRQAFKHFEEDGDIKPSEVLGWPKAYPSLVVFSMGYDGGVFIRAQCIHVNCLKEIVDENPPPPSPPVEPELQTMLADYRDHLPSKDSENTYEYKVFPGDPCKITDHDGSKWTPLTEEERTAWIEGIGSTPKYRGRPVPTHKRRIVVVKG